MTLQHAPLLLLWVCVYFITLITATGPTRVHEARQGPISNTSQAISPGPGPASIQTSTTTSDSDTTTSDFDTTTMSPTSTSAPSSTLTSTDSPTSSNLPSPGPGPASHSSAGTSSATPQPSSSSSPSPSPSPTSSSLDFTVQNMTTCTSALISWNYSGEEAELILSITNIGSSVDNVDVLSRIKAREGPAIVIEHQLADTNTSARSWTWSSVNVTQGWYEIQGLVTSPTFRNGSAPFFVSNGTDVTCLTGTSPQPSGTPLSASSPSASHTAHTASIVGGVVGAIVGVALVIFAGLYLRSRKRRKRLFVGVGFRRRKWESLKSTSSSIQPESGGSTSQRTSGHFHAHSESTGAILQDVAGGKASTPGGSDEDAAVIGEEKLFSPTSSTGMNPSDVLNTPVHYDRRSSLYSDQTPPAVSNEASQSRAGSLRMSTQSLSQNLEQQAQRIRNSMETSARRSERLSMPSLPSPGLSRLSRLPHSPTLNQPQEEYPLSSLTPIPVNRSVSTGAVSTTTRRTPRKPVPQYVPSLLLEDIKTDSVSPFAGGPESSQSHGTGMTAGAYGTPPDLVHKASFGDGRAVHYLIPDMPPPPQD